MASEVLIGVLLATAVSKQTNKQTNKQTDNTRAMLHTHGISNMTGYMIILQSIIDLLDYNFFCFTFFHAVSSLSQDSLTQSSSVLSPSDPFLAIDRSYTTCFRSKQVGNN